MKKAEQADFPRFEAELLEVWDKEDTFARSLKQREGQEHFSFYDGPPFANGLPHYGHALASVEKDAITRYKTMRGYFVPRRAGWDTHGLPVEYEVEKELGISGKNQILEMGIDKFNEACRASVFKYKQEWEDFFRRFGRWIDTENAYATLDDNYIESVWCVLSQLHQKDLVYRGFRSMPYCPRCATPLSNFELNQGYHDGVEDPSVYVTFPLEDDPETALLAWTTTPWTLPANAALAVNPKADYAVIRVSDDGKLVLAKEKLDVLDLTKDEYKIEKTIKGQELIGKKYQPLFRDIKLSFQGQVDKRHEDLNKVWQIYADEAVNLEEGTGVLHIAPRYGETDLEMGLRENLPLIESVDKSGEMVIEPYKGLFFKEADEHIIADLSKRGRLFAAETFTHTYPFCWRCDSPLLYYATPSWFVKVSELRDRLVKNNQEITWVPDHIKEGRFGNWLAEARDWGISRNRFWGAPLPIWVNEQDADDFIVVASIKELKDLSGQHDFDMHRPGIDGVVIERDGKTYRRVEEVFDCWFESGAMPYAQDHYPFEQEARFKDKFPADFIAEGLDQTRGWFYTLHVLATALFDQPAFKNIIVNGIILAADGKKLSKRLRNYPPIEELFDRYGADSLRLFLCMSPAMNGEDVRFSEDAVKEVHRNLLMTLWNVHSFLTTYAEVDGWQPPQVLSEPDAENPLDRWLLARFNQTIVEMTKHADNYEINRATRPLRDLIDDLSNWYVRRSRRRFWKSESDADKNQAYATLHYAMVRICQLLAPWAPFSADRIYRELIAGTDLPTSVHLTDWPEAGEVNQEILDQMASVREVVQEGLAQRGEAKIKVRQPLARLTTAYEFGDALAEIVAEEVNVKTVATGEKTAKTAKLNTEVTQELKLEGLAREIIRHVQQYRKDLDLKVNDRIKLHIAADGELATAVQTHQELISRETLAVELFQEHTPTEAKQASVEGGQLAIGIEKA